MLLLDLMPLVMLIDDEPTPYRLRQVLDLMHLECNVWSDSWSTVGSYGKSQVPPPVYIKLSKSVEGCGIRDMGMSLVLSLVS